MTPSGTLALSKGVVKEREMAASVSSVYVHVVDSVIKSLRPEFQNEGLDDSVLNEVQATPVQTPMQTPLPGTAEPVMYQYFPPGPGEPLATPELGIDPEAKIGRPAPYMQPPANWMSQKPLGVDVNIAYEEERDEMAAGISQPPITKDFFTLSSGKRKREDHPPNYLPGGYIPQQDGAGDFSWELVQSKEVEFANQRLAQNCSMDGSMFEKRQMSDPLIAALVKAKCLSLEIPQVDGVNDNLDSTVADEGYIEATDQEQQALNDVATSKVSEDEEPLNDNDDDPDDLDLTNEDPKIDDLVLAQFEKVSRTKNRWKCILKDGVMHLNHKDILFSKATGEFDF